MFRLKIAVPIPNTNHNLISKRSPFNMFLTLEPKANYAK